MSDWVNLLKKPGWLLAYWFDALLLFFPTQDRVTVILNAGSIRFPSGAKERSLPCIGSK